ncbi:MAG: DUF4058 domain-containing protein [Gemmataceae bacterium]
MPLHDWTKVPAGLFHHFHQHWSIEIARVLNRGWLPEDLSALVERRSGPKESDVLTVEEWNAPRQRSLGGAAVATLEQPSAPIVRRTTKELYARRANRVVVKHHLGRTVAVIEIVSPGNKDTRAALREFVAKTIEFREAGIHVLIVDPFPPTPRDPFGIHKAIWDEFEEEPFVFPAGKDRILVSYRIAEERVAYVAPVGLGDALPEMSLFVTSDIYVETPLESTYQTAWEASSAALRKAVETGVLPGAE